MKKYLDHAVCDAIRAVSVLGQPFAKSFIHHTACLFAKQLNAGKKILVAGNGGSLCDAAHFAEEFTGRFRKERRALPVLALTEPGHITCTANDFGFDEIFARGVQAFGDEGDVFVGLTTSGNSPNIVRAFEEASLRGLFTVSFLGKGGGALKDVADYELSIDTFPTSDRIQEAHMSAIHIIIELTERMLFPDLYAEETERLAEIY